MKTVHELRQDGCKVRVRHYRTSKLINEHHSKVKANEKGGRTTVDVTFPDGTEVSGEALCSDQDNYNKKLGVRIALGRALYEHK